MKTRKFDRLKVRHCSRCRELIAPVAEGSCTTGYGCDNRGRVVCYGCCTRADLRYMQQKGVITGYVDLKQKQITNWPGSPLMRIEYASQRRHNWWACRDLLHVWAIDATGRRWYGKGAGDGTCITMRRLTAAK